MNDFLKPNYYTVAGKTFGIACRGKQLAGDIRTLLPEAILPHGKIPDVPIFRCASAAEIRYVVNEILKLNSDCLWLRAAFLIAPNGKTVLLAAPPSVGKTSLSLALAFKSGWKIIADDVVLIEPVSKHVLSVRLPFSIKAGSADLLGATFATMAGDLLYEEWLSSKAIIEEVDCNANIDYAIILRRGNGEFFQQNFWPAPNLFGVYSHYQMRSRLLPRSICSWSA